MSNSGSMMGQVMPSAANYSASCMPGAAGMRQDPNLASAGMLSSLGNNALASGPMVQPFGGMGSSAFGFVGSSGPASAGVMDLRAAMPAPEPARGIQAPTKPAPSSVDSAFSFVADEMRGAG